MFEPMLARAKAEKRMPTWDLSCYAAEEKLDGWRLICWIHDDHVQVFGGRNSSNYTGQLPYLEQVLLASLPADTVVDGEIVSGKGFGNVQTVMRRSAAHEPSIHNPQLSYRVFDVLRLAGEDTRLLPWVSRRELVELAAKRSTNTEVFTSSTVVPATQESLDEILAAGGEGVVLKKKAGTYVAGRSSDWLKIKAELEADVTVVGFKPGTPGSAFDGLVGALEFEMDTGVRSRCSGMDMQTRSEITHGQDDWLGSQIRIKFQPGVGKDGKPRSPQFVARRYDLEAA